MNSSKKGNSKFAYLDVLVVLMAALLFLCFAKTERKPVTDSFSIAFLSDIHLRPDMHAVEGFEQAIKDVNKRNPDLVITGGDLIIDGLGVKYERADFLYNLYKKTIRSFKMPVYNTIGNHDLYGINVKDGSDSLNAEYGVKMFEKKFNRNCYYSFEHKGWKFMALNSIMPTKKYGATPDGRFPNSYIGMIDDKQIEWIKAELSKTDPKTPIVLSTHMPFFTVYTQRYFGTTVPNEPSQIIGNAKEVIELFDGHNLKLVLQGHLHTVEYIEVKGVSYLTGGAICGSWWKGPSPTGCEEGYAYVTFKSNNSFTWEYVDYGWDAASKQDQN